MKNTWTLQGLELSDAYARGYFDGKNERIIMKYKNGQPVEVGDVVHVKNRPYTVYSISDTVTLRSMCERGYIKRVFPADIGAYIPRLSPLFAGLMPL